jgi:hypothetical protein
VRGFTFTNTAMKLKSLYAGQEVAVDGCVGIQRVVARVRPNIYRITWREGGTAEVARHNLGVNVHGKWMFGAHDETTPSPSGR